MSKPHDENEEEMTVDLTLEDGLLTVALTDAAGTASTLTLSLRGEGAAS